MGFNDPRHFHLQTKGCDATIRMTWEESRKLLTDKYCLFNEIEKLEAEFWRLEMVGVDHMGYTDRFNELSRLVPHLVTPESKRIGRYIWGLVPQIRGIV